MKEIKAYIRPEIANRVISELESAGIKGMTILDVSTIGGWADPDAHNYQLNTAKNIAAVLRLNLFVRMMSPRNS